MKTVSISVRSLVEFVLREGSIQGGSGAFGRLNERALEGTRLHQKLQREAMKDSASDYQKEVPFTEERAFRFEGGIEAILRVEGRADGIYTDKEEGLRVVDEIKSTALALSEVEASTYPLHWAQAKCYACFLAQKEDLPCVKVRLSYIHTETEEVKYLYQSYFREELEAFWEETLKLYEPFLEWLLVHEEKRRESLASLSFPFESYREGQRTMAAYVYSAIAEGSSLFLQAPTGIGKTMSALFPALKAMGEGKADKLFYLTAKNVAREAAKGALVRLYRHEAPPFVKGEPMESSLAIDAIFLTARDKICFLEKRQCHPDKCVYARGHFGRVNAALLEALRTEKLYDAAYLQKLAQKHQVCPFELGLDLSEWCDVIICDYNYAFDPTVSLKRYFQSDAGGYVLLVDEAHNLLDRAREMFSASVRKRPLELFRKKLLKTHPLYRSLGQVITELNRIKKAAEGEVVPYDCEEEGKLFLRIKSLTDKLGDYLEVSAKLPPPKQDPELMEEAMLLYFDLIFFLRMYEELDEGYLTYADLREDIEVRLFNIDPSYKLRAIYEEIGAVVLFSATFTPITYYKELLGGSEEDTAIRLPSPFDIQKLQILSLPLPLRYRMREASIPDLAKALHLLYEGRKGHYMAFFPSYSYMERVFQTYQALYPNDQVLLQEREMDEAAKEAYLEQFREGSGRLLGFCVLGGAFSEGIDLVGESLIGAAIISVGLPQLSVERDLIKGYFERHMGDGYGGFAYAYTYPGFTRVLQAAGRVIRTKDDRGVVLLIDDRFQTRTYESLFPPEWGNEKNTSLSELEDDLAVFWSAEENLPGREFPFGELPQGEEEKKETS